MLLTCTFIEPEAHQVLVEWASSDAGQKTYRQIISDVYERQTIEQLGLRLLAILCYQRLLPSTSNDSSTPVKVLFLADFDALLKGELLGNERVVSERMVLSFLRILETDTFLDESLEIRQYATAVLDRSAPPVLDPLDGFSDQYMLCRARNGCTHKDALENIGNWFLIETIGAMYTVPRVSSLSLL